MFHSTFGCSQNLTNVFAISLDFGLNCFTIYTCLHDYVNFWCYCSRNTQIILTFWKHLFILILRKKRSLVYFFSCPNITRSSLQNNLTKENFYMEFYKILEVAHMYIEKKKSFFMKNMWEIYVLWLKKKDLNEFMLESEVSNFMCQINCIILNEISLQF